MTETEIPGGAHGGSSPRIPAWPWNDLTTRQREAVPAGAGGRNRRSSRLDASVGFKSGTIPVLFDSTLQPLWSFEGGDGARQRRIEADIQVPNATGAIPGKALRLDLTRTTSPAPLRTGQPGSAAGGRIEENNGTNTSGLKSAGSRGETVAVTERHETLPLGLPRVVPGGGRAIPAGVERPILFGSRNTKSGDMDSAAADQVPALPDRSDRTVDDPAPSRSIGPDWPPRRDKAPNFGETDILRVQERSPAYGAGEGFSAVTMDSGFEESRSGAISGELWLDTLALRDWFQRHLESELRQARWAELL